MKKALKIIGGGILALIVLGMVVGGGDKTTVEPAGAGVGAPRQPAQAAGQPAAAATPQPQAKAGDIVRHGNWEYTVTKVERAPTLIWSSFGNKTDAKGEWLVVSLTLKNIGTRNFGIARHDFEARDGAAVKYSACDSFACSSWLSHNKLASISSSEQYPPGVEVRTALAFDVNPAATGLRLVLKQARDTTIALD